VKTEAEVLQEQLAQAMATINMLQNELIARAQPTVGNVSDAIGAFTRAANAGNSQAKQVLSKFFEALDAGRDASSKLTIVRNGGTPQS
jgi:hypothetical protein